ncbi:putative type I restriction modification system, DNA specificity domain protein [Phaeobacter inhibens]|uniref:restriction endonuclease subunit S n=1 Tax=Phaeobacter inhibens TaxID=221822 RepID=UPI000C9AC501|nr:restriction endonuclease subunit S [Phaeobacter inhibens]AUR10513.1 putative type I restriction modification system, DNA specificity domain protein [Phaeobacter inhibens]
MSVAPLFRLKEDWEVTTLGDVAARGGGSIQTGPFGSQLHASDYVDQGIPSIMPQNITTDRISEEGIARITEEDAERLSKYRVRTGDIVYSRRGDVERRALVREENDGWLCGTGCLKVSLGESVVVPEYAAFYLSHPASKAWVVQHAVGATMPNLNTSILSALPFVLPPVNEQEQIANALSALDDKIELNRRMNETLEEMARALFRDWFVDFGPTRRQMGGATDPASIMAHAFPSDKATTLASLFPAKLGENGVPEGWRREPISELTTLLKRGISPKYADQGCLVVNQRCIRRNSINFDLARRNDVGLRDPKIKELKIGDVLVNSTGVGTLGRVATVRALPEKSSADSHVSIVRPDAVLVEPVLVGLLLEDMQDLIADMGHGSTGQTELKPSVIGEIKVVLADRELQRIFGLIVGPLRQKVDANNTENHTLAAFRDLLLPKLMSGEIRLKDLEAKAR